MSKQHSKPCSDCPWRRKSIPGWLGTTEANTMELEKPQAWIERAVGEVVVECHKHAGCQCAGISIFRANICKVPRSPEILQLPQDKIAVFSIHQEFIDHHTR